MDKALVEVGESGTEIGNAKNGRDCQFRKWHPG